MIGTKLKFDRCDLHGGFSGLTVKLVGDMCRCKLVVHTRPLSIRINQQMCPFANWRFPIAKSFYALNLIMSMQII